MYIRSYTRLRYFTLSLLPSQSGEKKGDGEERRRAVLSSNAPSLQFSRVITRVGSVPWFRNCSFLSHDLKRGSRGGSRIFRVLACIHRQMMRPVYKYKERKREKERGIVNRTEARRSLVHIFLSFGFYQRIIHIWNIMLQCVQRIMIVFTIIEWRIFAKSIWIESKTVLYRAFLNAI